MGLPQYVSSLLDFITGLKTLSAFGFTAALLEGLPIMGLVFTISNRVGAAMWAHGRCLSLILVRRLMFFQIWKNGSTSLQHRARTKQPNEAKSGIVFPR
jgi:hypothetical protein